MTEISWIPDSESIIITHENGTEVIVIPEDVPEFIDIISDMTGLSEARIYDNFEKGFSLHVDEQ